METLCKIRDVYRAIAEFEVQFTQMNAVVHAAQYS